MKHKPHILTKVLIITGIMMAWVLFPANIISQPTLRIGNNVGCSNTEIIIPILIEDFEDVAAFSLFIDVDTTNIEFIGIENINEVFATGNFIGGINLPNQFISLTWVSFTAANIESGIMCNLRVLLKQGSVDFNFRNNCELVSSNLTIIENVQYQNGTLTAFNLITPDPLSQSSMEASHVNINLPALPNNITYQWQVIVDEVWKDIEETTPYAGVQTSQLDILSVSTDMNNNLYRCLLSSDICSEGSKVSELTVMASDIGEIDNSNIAILKIYPNPVDNYLNCYFNLNVNSADLILINLKGEVLFQTKLGNTLSGEVFIMHFNNIKSGNYVLQLFSDGQLIEASKVYKI